MNDLQLATTEELLRELFSRFDACIFSACANTTGEKYDVKHAWTGGTIPLYGLGRLVAILYPNQRGVGSKMIPAHGIKSFFSTIIGA